MSTPLIPSAWMRWTPMRIAATVLVLSIALAAFTLVRAMQVTPVARGALPVLPNPASLTAPVPTPALDVSRVIERDVFAPDRTAPTNAYLLPSEVTESAKGAFVPPHVLVLGIAIAEKGASFATCQVGTDKPTIVRVGDKLGPYIVKSIEAKRVTIALPGGAAQSIAPLTSGSGN